MSTWGRSWRPSASLGLLAGPAAATLIGVPVLVAGLLVSGSWAAPATVPLLDGAAIVSMLVVAVLGALDVELRRDRRSLPVIAIGVAEAVAWAVHLLVFPGDVPGIAFSFTNAAASSMFLLIGLSMPLLLAAAFFWPGGPLRRSSGAIVAAALVGLAIGAIVSVVGCVARDSFPAVTNGRFDNALDAYAAIGLLPLALGLGAVVSGRRGDVRILGGVLSALTFSGIASIALLFLRERYSAMWYAIHLLALLPFLALLAGQLAIYALSVRAEQRALGRLQVGLDVAEAMATEVEPSRIVDRLLRGAMVAVGARRATLLRIDERRGAVVEAVLEAEPGDAADAPRGAVAAAGRPREDVPRAAGLPLPVGALWARDPVALARPEVRDGMISIPLVLGQRTDAVLVLATDSAADLADELLLRLRTVAPIAALLLRNARLLEEAQAAAHAKASFLNLAAHELRTPLSVVSGYVSMLADGTLGDPSRAQRPAFAVIAAKTAELSEQVERLLTASRLEGEPARRPAAMTPLDLVAEAGAVAARMVARARQSGAEVTLTDPGRPVPVLADRADLAVVLDNLVDNALTYSRAPAQVAIEVMDAPRPALRVRDSGIGVPGAERERIFEAFHRVDEPSFGYPAGTGLGLHLARSLTEAMGGRLVLETSAPGQGSVFLLTLTPAPDLPSSSAVVSADAAASAAG